MLLETWVRQLWLTKKNRKLEEWLLQQKELQKKTNAIQICTSGKQMYNYYMNAAIFGQYTIKKMPNWWRKRATISKNHWKLQVYLVDNEVCRTLPRMYIQQCGQGKFSFRIFKIWLQTKLKCDLGYPDKKMDLKSDTGQMFILYLSSDQFIKQIYSIVALVAWVPFLLADLGITPLRPDRESGSWSQALAGGGCSEMRIRNHSSNIICQHLAVIKVTRCQRSPTPQLQNFRQSLWVNDFFRRHH